MGKPNEVPGMAGAKTRRSVLTDNIKVICMIAAGGIAARLDMMRPARADDGGHGEGHGGNGHGEGHGGHGHGHAHGCFLKGTRIQTDNGYRRVEDLAVGDLLPTVFGGIRPIQWITRSRRTRGEGGWKKDLLAVRIARSAIAPDVPHADLYVTQGHALLIDGVLIGAGALVNGKTIALYPTDECEEFETFNIKLETHDVIYAEGAPCETLLRIAKTAREYADYQRVHGRNDTRESHCAPTFFTGGRAEIKFRIAALAPWRGPHKVDAIRTYLDQRALIV